MQDLTPEARRRLDDIAARHGVSADAAATLLQALVQGGGGMAQFSHPELGGMGQWSQGGMIMVGDMFNQGLRARVDALCTELAGLLREGPVFAAPAPGAAAGGFGEGFGGGFGGNWWPAELGAPASSGGQNDMRYAYFPAARRLAVQQGGRTSLYDTGTRQIYGASQQQGAGQSLSFSTDQGTVRLEELQPLDAAPAAPPMAPPSAPAPAAAASPMAPPPQAAPEGGDPLALIERLAGLREKGILSDEEFAAKKAELLRRL
ncbi:SHOCT domain-containing protein [Roseicella frigidaeris]|uniref:SHOCT domain-containing protein n=1 Tax=Roseicella frigidaeris TaxID=2230885 RepID=A0A327MAL3_9PROT|nr:SHOCT domain-containing protein [Roseicella frigidaeris]RAI59960.1 SHOCT domain-containing protein [Roseicella frigidaeris]